jgi:Rrf2 family protein
MVTLAAQGTGTVASARALAAEADVPYELARTILGNLADSGLLESRRGRSGGFELARPSTDIMLGDVLAAAGEPLQLNVCVADSGNCGRSDMCPVHPIWTKASDVLRDFFGSQSLEQVLAMGAFEPVCSPFAR